MAVPNGPGSLLSKGQLNLFKQVTEGSMLFRKAATREPEKLLAADVLKERKIRSKLKPTAADVAKLAGVNSLGFLYLGNILEKQSAYKLAGSGSEGDVAANLLENLFGKDSLISSLFSGKGKLAGKLAGKLVKKLGPKLAQTFAKGSVGSMAVGIGALAAGLTMMVVDGIKGAKNAEKWGVSPLNAGFCSAISSQEGGAKGALQGAKKWGLAGAGIGMMIGGPIGAAIGGVAGAAVGAVVGAIGAEKMAKFFKKTGESISKFWKEKAQPAMFKVGVTLGSAVLLGPLGAIGAFLLTKNEKADEILSSNLPFTKKVLYAFGAIGESVGNFVGKAADSAKALFTKMTTNEDGSKNIVGKAIDTIGNGINAAVQGLTSGFDKLGSFIVGEEAWNDLKNFFNDKVFGSIKKFFSGMGGWFANLFGLNGKAEEDMARAEWEAEFKRSAEYAALKDKEREAKRSNQPFNLKEEMDKLYSAYKESSNSTTTKVRDGIFSLEKSLSRGALFQAQARGISLDNNDDLYLLASTNPARDALVASVERLEALIERLATAIESYKPQVVNSNTSVQSSSIPLRDLLAVPGRV